MEILASLFAKATSSSVQVSTAEPAMVSKFIRTGRLLVCALSAVAGLSQPVFAQNRTAPMQSRIGFYEPQFETRSIGGSLSVRDSETRSIHLNATRYIRSLVIQAEGIQRDSMVEVMVNGVTKGTLYAPGRDPSYIVTIEEAASSIEFRHRSGAAMRIIDVRATMADWVGESRAQSRSYFGRGAELQALAHRTIAILDALKRQTTLDNEQRFLFPIKQKAGNVIVMASARGDVAIKTGAALEALKKQIDFAKSYLDGQIQHEDSFELVVQLLTIGETIDELLN